MGLLDIFNNSNSDQIKQGTKQYQLPDFRAGAFKENDLHSTGEPGSEHIHRNIGLSELDATYFERPNNLAVDAATLVGSTNNRGNTYSDNKPA